MSLAAGARLGHYAIASALDGPGLPAGRRAHGHSHDRNTQFGTAKNPTLVQVSDQTQRWSDSYERELASILAVQGEVARGIARSLSLALLPAEESRLANARVVNPAAHEAYLKGPYHLSKLSRADHDAAQRYFEVALQNDPGHALAYLGLSRVWA